MADNIDLGLFHTDPGRLARELRQDFKDDWFPDSLNYDDRLIAEVLRESLEKALSESDGEYVPSKGCVQNIPKKRFVLRYSMEIPFVDRAYYHSLARFVQPFFDPMLSDRVMSHRWNSTEARDDRYVFKHPIEQWRLFEGYVREQAGTNKVVLVTDVQNYFENISVKKLTEILRSSVPRIKSSPQDKRIVRFVADEIGRCLESWCFTKEKGLPQNRDASSILANIYLSPVDARMTERGYDYYRYMDDIRIVVDNQYAARAALQELITELRKLHLNVNAAKTMILEPGTEEREKELGVPDRELAVIDAMWRSRSRATIMRSLGDLKSYSVKLVKEGRTQERGFRFCVKRFENLALCEDLHIPPLYFREFIDAVIDELDSQPFTSDQLVRFLKAAPLETRDLEKVANLLASDTRALYDWQNYLLWQLLVYHGYDDDGALSCARTVFCSSTRPGDRAGAALFLGAKGKVADRELVAAGFSDLISPTEHRSAIIAIHELPFDGVVKERVSTCMPRCELGVYRSLHTGPLRGRYFTPLPPVNSRFVYDEVSQYD